MERQIRLEEKVFEEQRALKPDEPIQSELIHTLPPPPHKSSRISHPLDRYLGIISEDVEKIFFIENEIHGDDPETYNKTISDIDSKKWSEAIKSEINLMHSNQV